MVLIILQAWPDDWVSNFQSEIASFFYLCGDLSLRILYIMALGLQLEVLPSSMTVMDRLFTRCFPFMRAQNISTNTVQK